MKRIGMALAIVVGLLLVANGVMAWRVESQLAARIAAIRAAGDPASIADLKPVPIPDEQNAAFHLDRVAADLLAAQKDFFRFEDKSQVGRGFWSRIDRGEAPTSKQLAAIRELVDKHRVVADALIQAASCDSYASLVDFSLAPQAFLQETVDRQQEARAAQRLLVWQMIALIHEGKVDDAVKCGVDGLKLARLRESEPLLISYMVTQAIRGPIVARLHDALAHGHASGDVRASLDRELVLAENPRRLEQMLRRERALSLEMLEPMAGSVNSLPKRVLVRTLGWSVRRHYQNVMDFYDAALTVAKGPLAEFRGELEVGGSLAPPTRYGFLADQLSSSVQGAVSIEARTLALLRSLRVFNALGAFAEKNGREASTLDELGLPAEATADPFAGAALTMKRTPRGWVVYSVGKNAKDDGGDFTDQLDVGVGPQEGSEGL